MLKIVLGLLIGVGLAFAVVFAGEWLGHLAFTLPPMPETAAARDGYMAQLGLAPKLALVVTWFLAALVGAATGATTGERRWIAWAVVAVVLAGCVANFVAFPHPLWMIVATVALVLSAGVLAARRVRVSP